MFLGTLEGVASLIDRPLTEETRVALESALRYFREALPKHTADTHNWGASMSKPGGDTPMHGYWIGC